jgi:Zn-dependent M28 family amino/carboxypeptidase
MGKFFGYSIVIGVCAIAIAACAHMGKKEQAREYPGHPDTVPGIAAADFGARIAALSDNAFEGRGPGTPNGEAAADWIAAEMDRTGVKPAGERGYFQDVPAASITLDAPRSYFELAGPDGAVRPKFADEVAYWTPRFDKTEQRVKDSDLIFVGYGVHAPEYKWNDFEGVDVKGKTIVLLINDPGFITRDKTLFKGRAMTYYGRWTYKFEEAARRGAAAVIIVHETEPAAYGWQVVRNSNTGAKLYLDNAHGNSDLATVHSWITTEQAEALFKRAGLDYQKLRIAANKRGFKAVPMKGLRLNAVLQSKIAHMKTRNVIGVIKGLRYPDEYVLYTAHWDHLGVKETVPGPDKIHNGAVDNATGVSAILEIGEAFSMARKPPDRSVLIAAVTLEEQGLLGSQYMGVHPPVPLHRIVGGVNFDALLPQGRARDMTVVGSGASELEPILKTALRSQGRRAAPDPEPEKGSFYRSDHIELSKKGVPMLYAGGGVDLRKGGKAAGMAARDAYRTKAYHQPTDEYDAGWDLSGPLEDIAVLFHVGQTLANSKAWPNWYKGNEFRAIRDESLKEGRGR